MAERTRLEERAAVHAALGDPWRLAIVEDLVHSDRSPSELGTSLGIDSNLLAHHLDVLDRVGLIERLESHGDRRRRYIRLRPGPLHGLVHPPVVSTTSVVFVCTHNSARSQLAQALWNASSSVPASSAGTKPADRVHPQAARAARRRGLDLTGARPRPFALIAEPSDLIVTVCDRAHEQLAALGFPAWVLHWSVADPAEDGSPEAFDAAADALAGRVSSLAPHVTQSLDEPAGRRSRP